MKINPIRVIDDEKLWKFLNSAPPKLTAWERRFVSDQLARSISPVSDLPVGGFTRKQRSRIIDMMRKRK